MRNLRRNNIQLIDRISDLAVATIILSIGMMVLGLSMIIGSAICMGRGYSLVTASSTTLLLAVLQGIEFIADGVILAAFCTLVATTSPLAASMRVLRICSAVLTVYNAIVVVMGIALGKTSMGFIVPMAGLVVSGLILLLLNKLEASARKMVAPRATGVVCNNLRKAG